MKFNGIAIYKSLSRKKPIDELKPTKLAKLLTTFDLTALGVGSTLGVGVYVLVGRVARDDAGPAVIFSFLIAAIASVMAALCYAEFGARVPKAGSVYVYCYVTIGEFIAFLIGWDLVLEYSIGSASVVKGLSTNINSLTHFHDALNETMPIRVYGLSEFPDFFSFAVVLLCSMALAFGVKESAIITNTFTILNLIVVLFVIIAGSIKADSANWNVPKRDVNDACGEGGFAPYGLGGVLKGAATCFFAFVGFDGIATAGEEAKEPRKSIPISIIASLLIIFLAYFGISIVLTMMLPYYKQNKDAALLYAFQYYEWYWAVYIVSVGAIFALCAALIGAMFPLPRVVYAMSNDGLIFHWMGIVNERFRTPVYGIMFVGTITAILATFLDLDALTDMMSIGTMMAYSIVAASVLLLRYDVAEESNEQETSPFKGNILRHLWNADHLPMPTKLTANIVTIEVTSFVFLCVLFTVWSVRMHDELSNVIWWAWLILVIFGLPLILILVSIFRQPSLHQSDTFATPFLPWLPAISILINTYLMMQLDYLTWIRFLVWLLVGLIIYFSYGIRNSVERKRLETKTADVK